MKIAVCIKQIPVIARVRFDPETRTIVREGVPLEVNSYDLLAVSAAVKLAEEHGGEVTALTMGPPQSRDALVQCLALGADRAVLLTDRAFAGADTLATARALAFALSRGEYDLILCGKHSLDAETGQVGPEVAEMLSIPQVTSVSGLSFDAARNVISARRETDDGMQTVESSLPVLLACGDGIAEEMWPGPEQLEAAKEKPIEEVTAADLSQDTSIFGFAGSPTWVDAIESFESTRQPEVFNDEDVQVNVRRLVEELEGRGLFRGWGDDSKGEAAGQARFPKNPFDAIWVITEQDAEGALRPVTYELLGVAGKLAAQSDRAVAAVLIGHDVERHVPELAAHGADLVFTADHPGLAQYATLPYTRVLADAVAGKRPYALLLPATVNGRDLAARLAARLGLGLTGDCIDLDINSEGQLVQYKPAFGGNIVSPILSRTTPQMATVRPGMLARATRDDSRTAVTDELEVPADALEDQVTVVSSENEVGGEGARLYDADVVVSIGMGVGTPDNYGPVHELAETLDAAVAATREVTDRGWVSKQQQVGITGKAIAPKLYVAVGVSGNLNHMVGVLRAGIVVAINTRARAFIFRSCDYGIVGDWAEVVPALTVALREGQVAGWRVEGEGMVNEIKVGLHVPAAADGPLPSAARYTDFFRHAERLGYHGLWTEDRLFHGANLLEPLTLLALAAGATERIMLGTAVLLLSMRNASSLARQLSTLDHFSGGRVLLGVSVGGRPDEFPGLGMQLSERVPRLRENILLLKSLLRGEPVTYDGRFYTLEEAVVRPAAIRDGGIPLYMGGRADAVLRRAAELTEGWIGGAFSPPDEFRACWQQVLEHARELGRDPEQLEAGKLVYVAVDDDRGRALASLTPFLHAYYGPERDPSTFTVYGPPEEVAAELQEFVNAGVTTFMLGVPSLDVGHLERIASDVVPRLRVTE